MKSESKEAVEVNFLEDEEFDQSLRWPFTYCMSKKFWYNLYNNLVNKMGQDFLDLQYLSWCLKGLFKILHEWP